MEYDNTNSGVLFKNDKGDNEKRPDMTGTLDFEGIEIRVAAWKRVSSKSGKPFLSLKVERKEESTASPVIEAKEDDLPF